MQKYWQRFDDHFAISWQRIDFLFFLLRFNIYNHLNNFVVGKIDVCIQQKDDSCKNFEASMFKQFQMDIQQAGHRYGRTSAQRLQRGHEFLMIMENQFIAIFFACFGRSNGIQQVDEVQCWCGPYTQLIIDLLKRYKGLLKRNNEKPSLESLQIAHLLEHRHRICTLCF